MLVGSLFTGIGGIDLGLERAGMTVAWQAEVNSFCCQVLNKHWPDVPNLGDVTKVDWGAVPPVDLLCGGYPCQPFSVAGARKGTNDERHLWPHFATAIRMVRPRFVLLENVPGHLSLGFGDVLRDLATCGYDAEWDCIPAAAVGAPHRRDRLWVIAYPNGNSEPGRQDNATAPWKLVPNPDCARCGGGLGEHWAVEPSMGRLAYGVPNRMDQLRALGNAVVPQVAEHLGNIIMAAACSHR